MPVVMGRTRAQIRKSIGYNLGAVYASAPSSTGSTTTLVDDTLIGGDDAHNGKWVVFSDASAATVEISRVSDYTSSSTTLTLSPAVANAPVAADSYELWDDEHPPAAIHDFINQAVIDASDRIFDPVESLALHTDGHQLRHDIPSGFSMLRHIFYRSGVEFTRLHACNAAFDETVDSDITVSLDTTDKRQGSQSCKFVIAAGASAGDIATDSISSKDISGYDYIEFWCKSTVATSAGNLKILLDDTASCASPIETLSVPALSADTWTFCRVALANPEADTAIISVGLEYDSDLGACSVWLDDISVVANSTAKWERVPRNLWRIELGASDIVFDSYFHGVAPYHLLKLVGGDKPALLSSDTATSEIPDQYLIAQGTGMAFAASSGGPTTDPDQRRSQAGFWFGKASSDRRQFPLLTNVRLVA
jgi:hypothetical protein